MMQSVKIIICAICVLKLSFGMTQTSSSPVVQLERILTETSNEELMSFDMRVECVGRNKYGLSGAVAINFELAEKTMVEVKTYRSLTGNSDYKVLPYAIAKKNYEDLANDEYKQFLMSSIKDCSNWPQFEHKYEPPLEYPTYVMDKCTAEADWLPDNLPEGYYLIEVIGSGEVDFKISLYARLMRVYDV